jgi:two-component system, chemotaxis family, CheB/CheR fusion protein
MTERAAPPAHDPAAGRGRRVLVIEDNRLAADTLCEALEMGNCTVDVAHTGSDGLAKAQSLPPDVVLCDVSLPDTDGYQLARKFRADERLRGAFLVAVTGHALSEDEQKARDAGFDRHVAKPLSLKKLEQLMADATRT